MKCGRDFSDSVFKCPTSTNPRSATVVHKCEDLICLMIPLVCNTEYAGWADTAAIPVNFSTAHGKA